MNLAEKYTYEIYKKGSFSGAAKALYISQSSLSLTIKNLEKNLGFNVFDRSTSPISLTREGKIYIEYLEEIFNENNIVAKYDVREDISYYNESEPDIEKNGTSASPATAFASRVLPVPGGPCSRMPWEMRMVGFPQINSRNFKLCKEI